MWNIAMNKSLLLNNDDGFSLVEVLIALAVASIIMLGVASLLFSSLRLYGNGNASAEIQNEAQRTLNLTLDSIMEARGVCMAIPASDENSNCILLGDLRIEDSSGTGVFKAEYQGVVLAYLPNVEEMLLIDLQDGTSIDTWAEVTDGIVRFTGDWKSEADAAEAVLDAVSTWVAGMDVVGDVAAEARRLPWTMGKGVTRFQVTPAIGGPTWIIEGAPPWKETTNTSYPPFCIDKIVYVNGTTEYFYYYAEPVTFRVEIDFVNRTYNSDPNRWTKRSIKDDVAVRSRLDVIYVDIDGANGKDGSESTNVKINGVSSNMRAYRHW